jgi:Mce-associated membrane protein
MVVAARQAALDFYNLDHRHARADVDRVIASATGDFRRVYAAKSDALVREVVAKRLATAATIVEDGVAVEYAHGEFGQVLVALDLVKSQGDRTGEPTPERARVSVRKVGDRWLVANVQGVQ